MPPIMQCVSRLVICRVIKFPELLFKMQPGLYVCNVIAHPKLSCQIAELITFEAL